jgi:hypothetical protein
MESKRDKLISVYVSEGELQRIAECADVEKTSPNMWVRRVVTDIARRASCTDRTRTVSPMGCGMTNTEQAPPGEDQEV